MPEAPLSTIELVGQQVGTKERLSLGTPEEQRNTLAQQLDTPERLWGTLVQQLGTLDILGARRCTGTPQQYPTLPAARRSFALCFRCSKKSYRLDWF
jgi:hypothetical protein